MSFSNKIKGAFTGYAIGDALGRGTQFMTRPEVARRYPEGLTAYSQIIRDAQRSNRRRGDFSGHTQVILQLADSINELQKIDYMDFARRYKSWFDNQDSDDSDSHTRLILQQPAYLEDPHGTCHAIYDRRGLYEAPNEAMGRAIFIGMWPDDIERHVTDNCRLTHWDSRCTAASVLAATVANELLWHRRMVGFDHLAGMAMRLDKRVMPYLETAHAGTLDDFDIDDEETLWYVRKNLGIALWCLWHHDDPETALYDVISYGGDATANASLTMGLMGLKYGYNHLPLHLIDSLLDRERVEETAEQFIDTLQQAENVHDTDD